MERIVKFSTTLGPIYLDLEDVSAVQYGRNILSGKDNIIVSLSGGQQMEFNESFKADMERYMDVWMAHKNT